MADPKEIEVRIEIKRPGRARIRIRETVHTMEEVLALIDAAKRKLR